MKIDFNNQQGKPAGAYHVHRLTASGKPGRMVAWHVDSTEAARDMVAWWRKRTPRDYPLRETWVVLHNGAEVDRFTTADAVSPLNTQGTTTSTTPSKEDNMTAATLTRKPARSRKPSTKQHRITAKEQGFPACYLGPTGNFKPGYDARAKSDLRAAVAGERTGAELHRFTKATAQKLLAARGW